jgi:hypothetical protein
MHGIHNIKFHKLFLLQAIRYSNQKLWSAKNKKLLLPGKIKSDLYRFGDAEYKYGNQNALPPTTFKGEIFKSQTKFLD